MARAVSDLPGTVFSYPRSYGSMAATIGSACARRTARRASGVRPRILASIA